MASTSCDYCHGNNCDHCHRTLYDDEGYHIFNIAAIGDYTCCPSCMKTVRPMLFPYQLPECKWLVQSAKGRFILQDQSSLEAWCGAHTEIVEHSDTKFAVWKSDLFPEIQQRIWLSDRSEGGILNVSDLKEGVGLQSRTLEEEEEFQDCPERGCFITVTHPAIVEWYTSIAWKDYEHHGKTIFDFCAPTVEGLRKQISDFIQESGLVRVPMIALGDDFAQTLRFFAFPSRSTNFSAWYYSFKELLRDWRSGEMIGWDDVALWLPSRDFWEPRLEQINTKIAELQDAKRSIEGLIEAAADDSDNDNTKRVRFIK